MDVAALLISGIALLVSVIGTFLTDRRARAGQALAEQALADTHRAETRALWSDAIEAVHRVLIDLTTEPIGDRLQTLRIRFIALVDGLPEWSGRDRWLATEHTLGAALGREVLERGRRPLSVDEHVALLAPYREWGMALAQNLRHLRNVGYSRTDIENLRKQAIDVLTRVYARNGWGDPPPELQEPGG